jgi:hypothetical protein
VIQSIETFTLSTAIGYTFAFTGITILKIEIANSVRYNITFFLIDSALKILLGQPFVGRIKINLLYCDNSL